MGKDTPSAAIPQGGKDPSSTACGGPPSPKGRL